MTYSGIGRPTDTTVLQTFYEAVGFTEEEHRGHQRAAAMKAAGIGPEHIDKKERFKRVEARWGTAIAIINATGWSFQAMSEEAISLTRKHGEQITQISIVHCPQPLPPEFGSLIAEFFPNLQALNVAGTTFSDDDYSYVSNRAWLPHLKLLNTSATCVVQTPRGVYTRP